MKRYDKVFKRENYRTIIQDIKEHCIKLLHSVTIILYLLLFNWAKFRIAKSAVGKNNILQVMSIFMKAGVPKFSLKTIEVWGNSDFLLSEDKWTFTDKDGKELVRRKSLVAWKMENVP